MTPIESNVNTRQYRLIVLSASLTFENNVRDISNVLEISEKKIVILKSRKMQLIFTLNSRIHQET